MDVVCSPVGRTSLPPLQGGEAQGTYDNLAAGQPLVTERPAETIRPRSASFEQAVLPHLDAAYNLTRWLVRDATLAEDVVQDAVLRALGYFATYRCGNARAWFLRIVRNAAFDALAERRRGVATSLSEVEPITDAGSMAIDIADPADDPEAALARSEGLFHLYQAVAALPEELRECLLLREQGELSYKEIAQITGIPIGTVMSRLWRARKILLRISVSRAGFSRHENKPAANPVSAP